MAFLDRVGAALVSPRRALAAADAGEGGMPDALLLIALKILCTETQLLVVSLWSLVVVGPSAALAAIVASALPAETWRFVGFLPRKRGELEAVFQVPETVVAFESPRRVGATLSVLAALDGDRPVAVCRELTKVHEEVVRGTAAELAERYASEGLRGEVVLVVGPAAAEAAALDVGVSALARLVEAGARARPAAAVVAELTGLSANALYRALNVPEV
jgi:16S rRNA (cytidine1402-2'-O)-methyltransferase